MYSVYYSPPSLLAQQSFMCDQRNLASTRYHSKLQSSTKMSQQQCQQFDCEVQTR